MDSPWPQAHPCCWWTILFMRPTFYYFTGMARGALRRIAAHFVLGFPTHNPTHKKYVLYDFPAYFGSPRGLVSYAFETIVEPSRRGYSQMGGFRGRDRKGGV